jgi:hypothetical protein
MAQKTKKEQDLDKIIEGANEAKRQLERAGKVAAQAGDKGGAGELEDEARRVEKITRRFEGIRDKKGG